MLNVQEMGTADRVRERLRLIQEIREVFGISDPRTGEAFRRIGDGHDLREILADMKSGQLQLCQQS